ncbi:ABC transporter substrate-binding protein [Rhodobacter capsulatus]|uniref:ABC transporter substrate-binding protein n=1 Tax=Rhodobacter capsulatus TaxID=1061 RepID=A0A4U1K2K8_RHOCA|nr:ABC transporter substrate-binding protein [Rhodobacter capsulatus]TKD26230.1 ABC transporter substrate-binding protein [Rhodobacter capsulatus]
MAKTTLNGLVPAALLAFALAAPLHAGPVPPLVLAVGGEPEGGFDPVMGWGRYGNPLFQATLLRFGADLSLVGDLATGWSLSDDRRTWTIKLRQDAKFSDGTALTAEDVAFTFNTARDAGGLVDMKILREARVVAPDTVELELTQPQITFTSHLVGLGIVPKARYGADYARHPLGAGPFRMVEWRPGEQLVVEPNPYWHGGTIPFPRVSFVFGEEAAAIALAQTGAVQVAAVPPAGSDSPPQGMHALHVKTVDNRGVMFPMVAAGGKTAEGKPIGNDVTADPAIRRALNQLLDRKALVDLALEGHGRPAHGPADGLPWDQPAAALPDADPIAAALTLEAAGWRDSDGDGLREKDGREARFTLVYPASDSLRQALALGVAEQAKAVGIAIEPAGKSWDDIETVMHADAVLFGWGAHDPSEIEALYHGDFAGVDYYNAGYYRNPAVDAHLDAAQAAPDFAASLPEWQAAQWDGSTGFGARGDAAWAWLVNIDHNYWVSDCLDLGPLQIEPHGHGYPITQGLQGWTWTCK